MFPPLLEETALPFSGVLGTLKKQLFFINHCFITYLYFLGTGFAMDIERATFFVIATEDRPGQLARFSHCMSEKEVNLAAVWSFGTGRGNAEIMAIPRDPDRFRQIARDSGWVCREGSCFHLSGEDRAGALADTLDRIAQEGINLHAVDAIGFEGRYSSYIWCDEKDVEALRSILKGW